MSSFHNALYDAMYAALVTGWIDPAALPTPPKHRKPQKRKAFFSTLEYPMQPKYKASIFPTREKVMNGKKPDPFTVLSVRSDSVSVVDIR